MDKVSAVGQPTRPTQPSVNVITWIIKPLNGRLGQHMAVWLQVCLRVQA